MGPLQQHRFGPFIKGVVDTANTSLDLTGALQAARGVTFQGMGVLSLRSGTQTVLTLYDDQGTPAQVTSVLAVQAFTDGALAVAHSTVTSTVYLYRLLSTMDGWIDSGGTTHTADASPEPVAVLWTSVTTPPTVTIAEGLGVAYIAQSGALDASGLYFATRTYTDATRVVADLSGNLDNTSSHAIYFAGVVSFQQHLWGWGFGSGTTATTGYRPELARFGGIDFTDFSASDSITLGDRVRSERERIVGGCVAGNALFLGGPSHLSRVTGYGRTSWYKQAIDKSFGFTGPACMVAVGDTLYYWSPVGPMRCQAESAPEPLWEPVRAFVQTVVDHTTVVAGYDETTDTVTFTCDTGSGVTTVASFRARPSLWVGTSDTAGITVGAVGSVTPVAGTTSTPAGAPTSAVTTNVYSTTATANWTAGDASAVTQVEYRRQVDTDWTIATSSLAAGVTSYVFTGLTPGVEYEWRAAHAKGGQLSSYLGPDGSTQWTTSTTLGAPTGVTLADFPGGAGRSAVIRVAWTNSGDDAASTEVELAGPSASPPLTFAYVLEQTADPGVASATLAYSTSGTYWVRLRTVESGLTSSSYTTPVSITVTA